MTDLGILPKEGENLQEMAVFFWARAMCNIFSHSLANCEEPVLWNAFRLPFIKALVGGTLPHQIKSLHERCDQIVRVAPNELFIYRPRSMARYLSQNFILPHEYKHKPHSRSCSVSQGFGTSVHEKINLRTRGSSCKTRETVCLQAERVSKRFSGAKYSGDRCPELVQLYNG